MAYNHLLAYKAELTLRDSVGQLTPLAWAKRKYMGDEKGQAAVALLRRIQRDQAYGSLPK